MSSAATTRAVVLDFYGTLARATKWVSADEVLAEHGYELDPESRALYFADGLDGIVHDEHSQSREHYVAWQRQRTIAMLEAADVHPGEHDLILAKLRAGTASRTLEPYNEVPDVLAELRSRGLHLLVCSNWDWDLTEAVAESGLSDLVDVVVSSAWVGARKPHPRIYAHTLERVGLAPEAALFAGDTWGADVEGPLAFGMRPVYLRREGHWPDATCPHDDPTGRGVTVLPDLRGLLDLI